MKSKMKHNLAALLTVASTCLGVTSVSLSATIYVDGNGTGDYETIKEAVLASKHGDLIQILPGTYEIKFQDVNDFKLDISHDLTIESVAGPDSTIVDMHHKTIIIDGVTVDYPSVKLKGLTFRQHPSMQDHQLCILQEAGNLNIHNCTFKSTASGRLKAIRAEDFGSLIIKKSRFEKNDGDGSQGGAISAVNGIVGVEIDDSIFKLNNSVEGGAIFCLNTALTIDDSEFTDNWTTIGNGGAISFLSFVPARKALLSNSTFKKNVADNNGGAISLLGLGSATSGKITDCHFKNNATMANKTMGGAISVMSMMMLVADSSFNHNSSTSLGGAVALTSCFTDVTNCLFKNNIANGSGGTASLIAGGGISDYEGEIAVSDTTFKNNQSDELGGGTHTFHSYASFENVRYIKNKASQGGGHYSQKDFSAFISDSLFKKNKANIDPYYQNTKQIGGAVAIYLSEFKLRDLDVIANGTAGSNGGIYIKNGFGSINKCTIKDNEHHGLQISGGGSSVVIQKTTSCQNGSKDVKGSYIDYGNNAICKE